LIGKNMHDLFPGPVAAQQLEGVRRVIREDQGRVSESLSYVQGAPRWFRNSLQPIHDEHGRAVYALLHATDIHELKSTQQELAELNRTLEARIRQATTEIQDLYNNAPTGYHSLDGNGNFSMINDTEVNWLGYTREEMIGRPFLDFVTPESQITFKANFPAFKQRGWVRDLEFVLMRKDGSTFPVLVSATAIKDEAGNYLMSRSTVFDNTERHLAEQALKASETKYRLLFENMTEGFSLSEILTDADGRPVDFRLLDANNAYEHHTGFRAQDVIGKRGLEIFPQIDRRSIENFGRVALAGETVSLEYFSTAVDRYLRVRSFSPKPGQFAVVFEDITESKQAEAALHESLARLDIANHELERALRAKDEFLANMSHELRTPLNGILGMAEILLEGQRGPLNERQQSYVTLIESSGRHLLSLINDVLDLSKVEAGRLELDLETFALNDICQASLTFVKQLAMTKQVSIGFVPDEGIATLRADPRRVKQILVNLLNNAVKFTPSGGQVTLEVRADREKGRVELSVRDTGIGISAADQQRLFQPFTQLDNSLTRNYEGTGLGLALVKRLVDLHGGTISLESEPGQGSRFTVSLPWIEFASASPAPEEERSAPAAEAVPPADSQRLATILLVEDNPANIMVIGDFLESEGYRMLYAADGQEALAKAAEDHPDLILMDIQMPHMDGLEATRRLRADPQFAAVPIITLTAHAMIGDRERCLEAGATDYLSKPVKLRQLAAMLRKLLD
jgi:PAS domain S-box-containing protein